MPQREAVRTPDTAESRMVRHTTCGFTVAFNGAI